MDGCENRGSVTAAEDAGGILGWGADMNLDWQKETDSGALSILRCRAVEKGKAVRDACQKGCIGCGKCARNCKFGAITMENNLPVVDMEKCVSCLECVRNCPTGAMTGDLSKRKHAVIDQSKCVGCTLCDRQCKFEAITGALKEKHSIDPEKCVGCGQCAAKCPKKCITLE